MDEQFIDTREILYNKYAFPGNKNLALKHGKSQIIGKIEKPVKDYIADNEICPCCDRKIFKKTNLCNKSLEDKNLAYFGVDFLNFLSFTKVYLFILIFSFTLYYLFNYIFFFNYNLNIDSNLQINTFSDNDKTCKISNIAYLLIQIFSYAIIFCFILDKKLRINNEIYALGHEDYEVNESEFCLMIKNFGVKSTSEEIKEKEIEELLEYLNSISSQNVKGIANNSSKSNATINSNQKEIQSVLSIGSVLVKIHQILPVKNKRSLFKKNLNKLNEVNCSIEKEKYYYTKNTTPTPKSDKLENLVTKKDKLSLEINKILSEREYCNYCIIIFEDQNSKNVFYNNFKETGICFTPKNNSSASTRSHLIIEPLPELHLINWDNGEYQLITKRNSLLFYFLKFSLISLCFMLLIIPKLVSLIISIWHKTSDPNPYIKDIVWASFQVIKMILSFSVKNFLKLFKFDNLYYEKLILNYYSSGKTYLMIIISIFLFNSLVNSTGDNDEINFFSDNNNFYFNLSLYKMFNRIKSNILFRELITLSLIEMFNCRFSIQFLKNILKRIFVKKNNQMYLNEMHEYNEIQILKLWGFYRNMIIGCILLLQQDIFLGTLIFSYIFAIKFIYFRYILTCSSVKNITYAENGFEYICLNECNLILMTPAIQLFTVIFQCLNLPNLSKFGFYVICGLFNYDAIINKFAEKNLFNRSGITYQEFKLKNALKNSKINLENELLLNFKL